MAVPFTLTESFGSKREVIPDAFGHYHVWGHTRYWLELKSPEDAELVRQLEAMPPSIFEHARPGLGVLNFKNHVGYMQVLGVSLHVRNQKLMGDEDPFAAMLADITRSLAALPFSFNTPTLLPFEVSVSSGLSILYHRWLLLNAWVSGCDSYDPMEGALGKVLHDPYRKTLQEEVELPLAQVARFSPSALIKMVSHPSGLQLIAGDSAMAHTALGRQLRSRQGQHYFPEALHTQRMVMDLDTPENRFVKYVLAIAQDLNRRFLSDVALAPRCLNPDLATRATRIDAMISEWLAHPIFQEIGDLRVMPTQSMVLQRKEGYRDFLLGYSRLDASLQFPISSPDLQSILEAKDIAKLYEYWCYFQVADALTDLLGPPSNALIIEPTLTQASMARETRLEWILDGSPLVLSYDRTFAARTLSESYSVELRPDITLEWKETRYLFDAKFKLDGLRWEDDLPDISGSSVTREDLYKMHTYREAIARVASAIVLYPGDVTTPPLFRSPTLGDDLNGIGAIPLRPGQSKVLLLERYLNLKAVSQDH